VQFIRARDGGFTRVTAVRNYGSPLEVVMQLLGLEAKPGALLEVSPQVAASCIAALLWKDLAYKYEFMPREAAERFGESFVEQYTCEGATFYTNGKWDQYHQQSTFGYIPLTSATFSAVVIVVHPEFAACLVVEDED
jgi:hypothetical protein